MPKGAVGVARDVGTGRAGPQAGLDRRPARALRRPDPGAGRAGSLGTRHGPTWPACWPAPSCGANCGGVISSKGFRACSTPATRPPKDYLDGESGGPSRRARTFSSAAADPANLYGSGAPLDIPLLDGGTGRLSRIAGNFLVMNNGRPVLVIEAHGKRLTGLASASQSELHAALARVVELAGPRRQVLKVETYNGEPALQSPVASRLAELGFVRDYPGMTYYGAWARQTVMTQSPREPS